MEKMSVWDLVVFGGCVGAGWSVVTEVAIPIVTALVKMAG